MATAIIMEKKIKVGSKKNKIKLIETQNPTWLDLYENICGQNTGLLRQPMAASQRRMIDSLCTTTVVNSSRKSGIKHADIKDMATFKFKNIPYFAMLNIADIYGVYLPADG